MLRLIALSWFGLVYLTITAHCTVVKRSASRCTTTLADTYCKMRIQSSRNPSGNCEDGAIVCYMASPRCRKAAHCEDACGPLGGKGIYVRPVCDSHQCLCEVSDACTDSNCKAYCVKQFTAKKINWWMCMPNNTCSCSYRMTCRDDAHCRYMCEKRYPGKIMLSTQCSMQDRECFCEYLPGSAGTLRPSELIMALILLTTLVKIPAPAQGKLWTLLISPAMFGLLISQLAWV